MRRSRKATEMILRLRPETDAALDSVMHGLEATNQRFVVLYDSDRQEAAFKLSTDVLQSLRKLSADLERYARACQ